MRLARRVREFRILKRLTQEQLAFESGLHRTFVAHVERGVRNISIDNIEKLATALGVRCEDLFHEESGRAPDF